MIQKEICEGDLLYNAVHGLCRMDKLIEQNQSGKKVACYSLIPKIANKMKMRFIVGVKDLEISGFHTVVSPREANRILDYLKAGDASAISGEQHETWHLAQTILSFSQEKIDAKDQRKRQILERSVKGLLGELAFVFKITLKETAVRVQKSLGKTSKINSSVAAAFAHAVED